MRRHLVRTIFFVALLLGLAAAAPAQVDRSCSNARVAGEWGYSWTGTIILPTGPISAAAVGTFTGDAAGDLSGTQTSSLGGGVAQDTLKGTLTLNPDCTGTMTVGLYDQSGNLLRTAVWAIVYVDDAREARAIFTSLVLPNGMSLPTIGTANAKRLFRNRRKEQ
jgi:hypothetical protein